MRVLLVWEEVPERTRFYLLDGEKANAALAAHGCFVNVVAGDPQEAADRLNCLLTDESELNIDIPLEINGPVKVVHSGFVM